MLKNKKNYSIYKNFYCADFETTQFDEEKGVRVYLWCVVSNSDEEYGESIESFIEYLKKLPKCIIYFHNLKFDSEFIHYYALKNNIKVEILEKKETLYSFKIFNCEIRDSLNFLPMSLKDIGELYCNKFKKTSIDYNVGWEHKATSEEVDYCFNDCYVLQEGLTNYLATIEEVLLSTKCFETAKKMYSKITNSSIAFSAFREMSNFDKICPKTTLKEYLLFKNAYKGAIVYSNPKGIVKNVLMIDCNSMYPFCYSSKKLPVGKPIILFDFKNLEKFDFYICEIFIKYDLKENKIPIIGGGLGIFGNTIYKKSSLGLFEKMTVCNIDLNLIKKFYDCEIELVKGYAFQTAEGMFKNYCDVFLNIKNNSKGIKRQVAKVFLNSPYGKTAMNGLQEQKEYYIDLNDNIKSRIISYSVDNDLFQYIPIAIAITAYARELLLTTADAIGFEHVHYMDTDSIKFDSNIKIPFELNDSVLGDWKNEGLCKYFKTIAPKKYVYYFDGKINYTCAGFNKKILKEEMKHGEQVSEEEALELMNKFDKGLTLKCLQSKKVKGGRALLNVEKMMK